MCKEGNIPLACDAIEQFVHVYNGFLTQSYKTQLEGLDFDVRLIH